MSFKRIRSCKFFLKFPSRAEIELTSSLVVPSYRNDRILRCQSRLIRIILPNPDRFCRSLTSVLDPGPLVRIRIFFPSSDPDWGKIQIGCEKNQDLDPMKIYFKDNDTL